MRSSVAITVALLLGLATPPRTGDAQPLANAVQPTRRPPVTFGGALGLTFTSYEADTANAANVGSLAIGFDMQLVVWVRPVVGVRTAVGVEFLRGPADGPNDSRARGSYGLASVALALRTPPRPQAISFGVDLGASVTFESLYRYSYQEGNIIYLYPENELPLRAGPFVEASLRGGDLLGWLVTYRQFAQPLDPDNGRLKGRLMISFSASR